MNASDLHEQHQTAFELEWDQKQHTQRLCFELPQDLSFAREPNGKLAGANSTCLFSLEGTALEEDEQQRRAAISGAISCSFS